MRLGHKRARTSITSALELLPPSVSLNMDTSQRLPTRPRSSVSSMSDVDSFDLHVPLSRHQIEKNTRASLESNVEERQQMLGSDPFADGENLFHRSFSRIRMTRTKKICIAIIGAAILVWLLTAAAYLSSGVWKTHTHAPISHKRRLTYDDARSTRFRPNIVRIDWTEAQGEDGTYLIRRDGAIELAHVNGSSSVFVREQDVVADQVQDHPQIPFDHYWISPDMEYVLLATDSVGNWRHSFDAKYWIHNVATKKTESLVKNHVNAIISYAIWSPTGHSLAYVMRNNLFIRPDLNDAQQLTSDGGNDIFNGVPDWVYEEEIYQDNSAIWWAPDSSSLAFLKTDERQVENYPLEFFILPSTEPGLYPDVEQLSYPKPGTPNPVVNLYFYDVQTAAEPTQIILPGDFGNSTRLITEIKWMGSQKLFVRETDRDSATQRTIIAEPRKATATAIEELAIKDIDDGWFEVSQNTHYVPPNPAHGRPEDGYLDLVISNGYRHLALFSPIGTRTPKMLTSGEWEVVGGSQAIDTTNGLVYYLATTRSAMDRHLYSVSLVTGEIKALTDDSTDGYYLTSFSPGTNFYVLGCAGPGVPWEKVLSTLDPSFEIMLEDNKGLEESLAQYDLPEKVYSTITIDGYQMNTVEMRPPGFDSSGSTKYPVLFRPYGGPTSQTVDHRFNVDWHTWLASDPSMEYIVVAVDGRGTGYMGRKLRIPIRGQLGKWEANDQIEAARLWKQRSYVDTERFAIWGWSFGGYLTLKVMEAGSKVFQYGVAVAPVTDWRFYDSVYTERYMGTIEDNLSGYEETAVSKVDGFRNATRVLVMHGTGDDNVHYQNTLSFVDKLNLAGIENYDMHVFPDSDHSMTYHNANPQVYHRLSNWLQHALGVRDSLAEDRQWKGHLFEGQSA